MTARQLFLRGAVSVMSAGLLAACSSSGSTAAKSGSGSAGAPASLPAVGTTPTTIHVFSQATSEALFGPDGKAISDPNAIPKAGDYFSDSAQDYLGDHTHHGSAVVGTDHLVCLFVTVTASGASARCDGEIVSAGSMIYADQQAVSFTANTPSITLTVTGGTGRYAGAQGSVISANVASSSSNTSDDTLTISAPAGGTAPTAAPPTLSGTPTTLRYFSHTVVNDQFTPDGKAISDPNAAPAVGDYFVSTDVNYAGSHTRHDKTPANTDHLVCVVLSLSGQTSLTARCDGEFAMGNSLLVVDHSSLELGQSTTNVTLSFTGGTGSFKGAHGTIRSSDVSSNSNDSDIVLSVSK